MKPNLAQSIKEAFLEHRDEFGVDIEIDGQDIEAIVGESQFARELMEGGFADEGDIEVKFLLSDLNAIPGIGNAVSYRERSFKVSRLGIQPGSLIGEITCRPRKR